MPATLKDIAEELNISVTAVSRALRDMPDIGPKTTKLVKETAERLGYRRNMAARYLKTNRSMMLGMVVTDIGNPVFAAMYKGIECVCQKSGYTLLLGNSNESAKQEGAVISNMLDHGIDGILLVPSMENQSVLRQLEQAKVPYLILQRKFPGLSAGYVQSNDYEGGCLAARHLYELGHRRFLYVSAPMHISSARDRYQGFMAYLREQDQPESAVEILECDGTRAGSCRAIQRWMADWTAAKASCAEGEPEPGGGRWEATAIFCFSDYVAYGVYSALTDQGIRIPEDISVMGYDNNEYSDMTLPPLTTVDICPAEIGRQAAEWILDYINDPREEKNQERVILQPKLVVRGSTAAAPSHRAKQLVLSI